MSEPTREPECVKYLREVTESYRRKQQRIPIPNEFDDALAAFMDHHDAIVAERDATASTLADCERKLDAAVRERDKLAEWKRETESFARTFLGFGMTHENESVWSAMGGANQNYSYYVEQCDTLRARLAAAESERDAAVREVDELGAAISEISETVSGVRVMRALNLIVEDARKMKARLVAFEKIVEAATEWLGAVGNDHTRAEARLASVTYDYIRAAVAAETQGET